MLAMVPRDGPSAIHGRPSGVSGIHALLASGLVHLNLPALPKFARQEMATSGYDFPKNHTHSKLNNLDLQLIILAYDSLDVWLYLAINYLED